MDELKRQAAARALEDVQDGMKLGLGTGSTAKHFVDLLGEKVRAGLKVAGVPTSESHPHPGRAMRHPAHHARRDRPARPHRRRRRRDRPCVQSDQGRRRGAAARKDRRRRVGSHDRDCRRQQSGRCSRPFSAAGRGHSVRLCRHPARHGRGICGNRQFRANGARKGKDGHFLSPMAATALSMPI